MNIKALVSVCAMALGFCSFAGVYAMARPVDAPATVKAPTVIVLPEITIVGIDRSSPTGGKPLAKAPSRPTKRPVKVATAGRSFSHELSQGGRPEATTVHAWGM